MADSVTLAEQLSATAAVVHSVTTQGRSLTEALTRAPAPWRAGVQALAFHALRHWGEAMALTGLLAERPPKPQVAALLGVALTLLRPESDAVAEEGAPAYPAHTVVDQTVAALGRLREGAGAQGFVNACLRRYLREQAVLRSQAQTDAQAQWNHPFWWIKRLRRDHPLHWQQILAANQRPAPMVLRVNRRKQARDPYLALLAEAGLSGAPLADDGVVLAQPCPVERLPGWSEGWVSVQDGAAQWAAPLLLDGAELPPGARVLDACAAPGGKTAHLLERADLAVWALELDGRRATRIHDNLARLGLSARVVTADAGNPQAWWDGQPFDAILLDAPCTASGIVRRHPDVRWLRRPTDIDQLAEAQRRLLDALWPLLRPGGRLLYATCSVFRAEGDGQMDAFAARHADAQRLDAPGHVLPARCDQADGTPGAMDDNVARGFDGFYYALWRKTSS